MSRAWGAPGLKVSCNVTLLKRQEKGLPVESGFLQRSAYKTSELPTAWEVGGDPGRAPSSCHLDMQRDLRGWSLQPM